MLYGGIEAGGTKMVCGIADESGHIIDRKVFKTEDAKSTIYNMVEYFKNYDIASLGIASFGPIDLDKESNTYGYITSTPKAGWENTDFIGPFKAALNIPIGFDTDVNGAVFGEVKKGKEKDIDTAIYITIGTGIGVGVYVNNSLLHGLVHPEAGHIIMKNHDKDDFEGCCKYHKHCFEGMASGPAIKLRWGVEAKDMLDRTSFIEIESYYIAQAVTDYILTYSPKRIYLWGGVIANNSDLMDDIRNKVKSNLNGYINSKQILEHIDEYIITPTLEYDVGLIGAIELGRSELG